MITIDGIPVKTRLPTAAWVVAGLAALCLVSPLLMQFLARATSTVEAYHASIVAVGAPWF
jgi:hypothetical protein